MTDCDELQILKLVCLGDPIAAADLAKRIAALLSRAHAAESQLAAMGEALRNAACTCPLPYRAIKPEEHEESCLSLKVLSRLPSRAKAWMGLRENAERIRTAHTTDCTLGQQYRGAGCTCGVEKFEQALAALRALEVAAGRN